MIIVDTFDRLLLAAAESGELEYRHTTAAAKHLYLCNGADVDVDAMKRISALIEHRYLRITALTIDCPVHITPAGQEALQITSTSVVYSTDDPQLLARYRQAVADRDALTDRLDADLQELGAGPEIYGSPGGHGYADEFTAVAQRGRYLPPGWAAAGRGKLRPIAGPAGDVARQWLADHQPADPRHELAAHGLPRQVWIPIPGEPGENQITQVELLEHDGVLWARYAAEPGGRTDFYDQPCTWTRRDPHEYPAAKEAASR